MDVLSSNNLAVTNKYYASDLNPWLVGCYITVQGHLPKLLRELEQLCGAFLSAPVSKNVDLKENSTTVKSSRRKANTPPPSSLKDAAESCREDVYYWARTKFNAMTTNLRSSVSESSDVEVYEPAIELMKPFRTGNQAAIETAALFIFLNKTCFRGVYRENQKGFMNTPYGNPPQRISIYDPKNLEDVSKVIQPVEFNCEGFQKALSRVTYGSIVYLDPPYVPVHKKSSSTPSFVGYTSSGFDDDLSIQLFDMSKEVVKKYGALVVISNSNTNLVWNNLSNGQCQHCDGDNTVSNFKSNDGITTRIERVDCRRAIHSKNPAAREYEIIAELTQISSEE